MASSKPSKKILEIGAGSTPKIKGEGVIYLDRFKFLDSTVVWDLENVPLPFQDSIFDEIYASHILEHISNLFPLMNDLHRILKPRGRLNLWLPHFKREEIMIHPDHKRFFNRYTIEWFSGPECEEIFKCKKWRTLHLDVKKFYRFAPNEPGRRIKNPTVRRLAWYALNFWHLLDDWEIEAVLSPVK
jgi:SAM-dependent methyltransferase